MLVTFRCRVVLKFLPRRVLLDFTVEWLDIWWLASVLRYQSGSHEMATDDGMRGSANSYGLESSLFGTLFGERTQLISKCTYMFLIIKSNLWVTHRWTARFKRLTTPLYPPHLGCLGHHASLDGCINEASITSLMAKPGINDWQCTSSG